MADTLEVSLFSRPQVKKTWEGTDLIENSDMQGGGLQEIIAYICTTRVDVLTGRKGDEEIDPFGEKFFDPYKKGHEKDDFAHVYYCVDFVKALLEIDVIVGIEEEARFIIAMVYKYYQKKMFALKEKEALDMLESEGWLHEEVNNPDKIALKVMKSHFSKFNAYSDVFKYTSTYVKSYFNAKGDAIIEATLIEAEMYFKTGDFSGQKRKKILRALGASKNQVQEINSNWTKIEDFLNAKKLEKMSYERDMIRAYKINKEIKPLLNNDLKAARQLVRKGAFMEEFAKSSFLKRTKKTGLHLVDAVLSLKDAHNKDDMMDNLLSGAGGCFGTGPGFAVSAFLAVGNDFWDNVEEDMYGCVYNSCGFKWGDICATKKEDGVYVLKEKRLKSLMLVYKEEKCEPFKNKDIQATSIRILDAEKAKKIFGFKPAFVNYYMADDPYHVCRTRCYQTL
ncbi:hypothetical protein [Saccharicrinis fermentans]|uniref:Uncharacterized protein n=1 Tax=Saccharicrinis fermentans DSM 9555 = JCM 21142 TaxID=869213 RepID=W7YEF3_9BACT|nr:hypothetical protein [Saccharicrinis fermentans]GAF05858.1 hypothetical protein JCM21142_114614 [Saccharicrinis fermentans DSM 9555 = JCM 21142]